MIKTEKIKAKYEIDISGRSYYLTYAEEGFSPLSLYLKKLGYTSQQIRIMADEANRIDDLFFPSKNLPMCLIPRRFVRGAALPSDVEKVIEKYLLFCEEVQKVQKVVFNFSTPKTPLSLEKILTEVLLKIQCRVIQQVFIEEA